MPTIKREEIDDDPSEIQFVKRQKRLHAPLDIIKDQKGGLVLKVGKDDDIGLVCVHKIFMTMFSPRFAEMLKEKEDDDPAGTEEDPLIIEDERKPFIEFCHMAHGQAFGQHEFPLKNLPTITAIAEKYGCAEKTKQWIAVPLREFFHPNLLTDTDALKQQELSVQDVICIAFIAGDTRLFSRATRYAISHWDKAEFTVARKEELQAIIPTNLFGKSLPDSPTVIVLIICR